MSITVRATGRRNPGPVPLPYRAGIPGATVTSVRIAAQDRDVTDQFERKISLRDQIRQLVEGLEGLPLAVRIG